MKQLKNAWYIGLKELKIFASDRAALIFSIIFPFFFVTLFYFLFQGIGAQAGRSRTLKCRSSRRRHG